MTKEFIHNFIKNTFSRASAGVTIYAVLLVLPCLSFAATGELKNPLKTKSVSVFVGLLLDVIIEFGTPLAALVLVYTGYTFVTSLGDSKKLEQAKNMFWWTVIGTALIVGAKAIQILIESTVASVLT